MLGPGKLRGMQESCSPEGVFAVLAIDHRHSLRTILNPEDPDAVGAEELTALKLELIRLVGRDATGVLVDPEYSAAQALAAGALPGSIGVMVSLEDQSQLADPRRGGAVLPGWSVDKLKRMGASLAKLALPYPPADEETAVRQDSLVSRLVADCNEHDIPLLVQPIATRIDDGPSTDHRVAVVESARRMAGLGPDVVIVGSPSTGDDRSEWRDACAELDSVCTRPWALASGGADFERFRDEVEIACTAGASGFIAGRALWREAATTSPGMRSTIIDTAVRSRLRELRSIATATGRPWQDHFELPSFESGWHVSY